MPLGFEVMVLAGTVALKPCQGWNVYRDISEPNISFLFSGTHGRCVGRCVSPAQSNTGIAFGAGETQPPYAAAMGA